MITPGYSLTAPSKPLPVMALDFTTAVTDARVSTTRAGDTATRINASGVIEIVNANLPRYDFDPVTLVCKGLLCESARTNLLLNSLIDGTNLATQSVTLSAIAYTLTFYGSGSVAISGGHTATVTGAGNYPARQTYTFTPTAGNSTFTVTGDVKYAQLEAGTYGTSFIPTAGTSVLRAADVSTMTGTNFSSWYNATEGTFQVVGSMNVSTTAVLQTFANVGDPNNDVQIFNNVSASRFRGDIYSGGALQRAFTYTGAGAPAANTTYNIILGLKASDFAMAVNGNAPLIYAAGLMPVGPAALYIGCTNLSTQQLEGHVKRIAYYKQKLLNAEIQALSK